MDLFSCFLLGNGQGDLPFYVYIKWLCTMGLQELQALKKGDRITHYAEKVSSRLRYYIFII